MSVYVTLLATVAFAGVLIGIIMVANRVSKNMVIVAKVNLFAFIYACFSPLNMYDCL